MVEYKTEIIGTYNIRAFANGVGSYGYDQAAKKKAVLDKVLNENAAAGWRLKATQACAQDGEYVILFFEREAEGEISL